MPSSRPSCPGEIIVADDGSRSDTGEVVARLAALSPVPLIHSWQEDKGFRLARSRNRAIAKAKGEYIVLVDGDIVLERHFIEDHLGFARPGFFVQGTRVLLSRELSAQVLGEQVHAAFVLRQGSGKQKELSALTCPGPAVLLYQQESDRDQNL